MPEPITIYADRTCEDTAAVRDYLDRLNIDYKLVYIEEHPFVEQFVEFINSGDRSTPTMIFGDGKRKLIVVEPTMPQLEDALRWAGYKR